MDLWTIGKQLEEMRKHLDNITPANFNAKNNHGTLCDLLTRAHREAVTYWNNQPTRLSKSKSDEGARSSMPDS